MQPYVGEIRMFAGNFAPAGWMFCDGSILPIAENETLFILIGTTYGGDGQETFALPDLRGRLPVHQGQGSFGNSYSMGEMAGAEIVTLTPQQLPGHSHPILASGDSATSPTPAGHVYAAADIYSAPSGSPVSMSPQSITPEGGNQPHENVQPYLALNFIISLFGVFPSQS